ncbi:Uncharacterised protein [Klebsiella pneumoniae]|nr:Uncharacterised protein [Klebsiella pneumoniae]
MKQSFSPTNAPLSHLACALAYRFGFSIDDVIDSIQTGHCANAETDNRFENFINFDFKFRLNPCCISDCQKFNTPHTWFCTTFDYFKWLNLF